VAPLTRCPLAGLRPYTESAFATSAQAQQYGRSLAARLLAIKHAINYKGVLAELAAHRYDPDVTAAFFAALGSQRTRLLPLEVNRGDNELRGQQIADISDALGTAISAGEHVRGFQRVREELLRPPATLDDTRGMAKLVSHGAFSADWLAQVVRGNALDPVMNPVLARDRRFNDAQAFGVFLHALGGNPAAARMALGSYAGRFPVDGGSRTRS
jgi:hypothetical protein